MIGLRLFRNELRLLSRSTPARALVLVVVVLGILGMNAIENANQSSFHNMSKTSHSLSLGEARYAATGGAAVFAMLTLFTLSRDQRKRSRDLLEASHDYTSILLARIVALLAWAGLSTGVTFVAGWITHLAVADTAYEAGPYVFSFGAVLLPALAVSVLLSSGLYLALGNLEVAFLAFAVFYVLGINSANYLHRWVHTHISIYSDFAGMSPVGRYIVYNRVLWLCVATMVALLGLLIQRRPGYGIRKSLVRNARGAVVPVLVVVFAALSAFVYVQEPYLQRHKGVLMSELLVSEDVRLQQVQIQVTLHPQDCALAATARYTFEKDADATAVRFATNAGLEIQSARLDGEPVAWKRIPQTGQVQVELPPGDRAHVAFTYRGTIQVPSPGASPGYICEESVYLLEPSNWLFQPLSRHNRRILVSGEVVAPSGLTVVTPGSLESVEELDGQKRWKYRAVAPHLQLGLFAADFRVEKFRVGDIDVELYLSSRHHSRVRKTRIAEYIADLVGYYQETIGPYPFREWPIKVVESPLYKPGGHSSLNVVTVAEYVFNRRSTRRDDVSLGLGFRDVKLIAHEIAHQWWGTGVLVAAEQEWSSEGLVEYAAYRYASSHLHETVAALFRESWRSDVQFQRAAYHAKNRDVFPDRHPEEGKELSQEVSKVRMYSEMPLRLVKAEEHVGRQEFTNRLAAVYRDHQGRSLGYDDFLSAMGLAREVMTIE